jgi:hypothetical protein
MGKNAPRETGKPIAPVLQEAAKARCESKGPGYRYDPQTNACKFKMMGKSKPQGAPEQAAEQSSSKQAEEQSSSEHSSDYSDDDLKKKKKKRHHD